MVRHWLSPSRVVSGAGCGSSGSSGSPGPAASSSPAAAGGTASAATASFVSIVEPFDPGHPARAESAPASCGGQSTAVEIERCYQAKTENVDAQIDVAQPSTPSYYRVPTGKKFEFGIDYSKLAKDPNADKGAAGYLYAPGAPVAVWA